MCTGTSLNRASHASILTRAGATEKQKFDCEKWSENVETRGEKRARIGRMFVMFSRAPFGCLSIVSQYQRFNCDYEMT
jgi:hypothetical protein